MENSFHRVGVIEATGNTMGQVTVGTSYTTVDQKVKEASERSLTGKQMDPRLGGCRGGVCGRALL